MDKKIIIAIVGPSGAGKTQVSLHMSKEPYCYPYISSYTTRPMRPGETNGVEHTFVTPADIPDHSEMIAWTKFGDYEYWATKEQVKDRPTTYVIDEKGVLELIERFGDEFDILKVYIKRENINVDKDRINRDNDRIILGDDYYDLVINNNFDNLESFLANAAEKIYFLVSKKKFNIL